MFRPVTVRWRGAEGLGQRPFAPGQALLGGARLTDTEERRRGNSEKRLARVARSLTESLCPDCWGTRLSRQARAPLVEGINLAEATAKTLDELIAWVPTIIDPLPREMHPMARSLARQLSSMADRLVQLGLG